MSGDGLAARPHVSIIIPTRDRANRLKSTLEGLSRQSYPLADLEIIVCADGCRDGTVSMIQRMEHLPLTVLELPGVGPAGARNAGARAARAPLVLFMDDDVEPTVDLVRVHVEAHSERPGSVVVGPYPPSPRASRSLFRLAARNWWTQHFHTLSEPGHRFRYTDVLAGNLSMPKGLWRDVGELDERLRAHEDYELGLRLITAGVPIVFAPGALGYHHEYDTLQLDGSLRRALEEGRADALIGELHPHIKSELRLVAWQRTASRLARVAMHVVFRGGSLMDRAAHVLERLVVLLDHCRLRRSHSALFTGLKAYWYIRGVSQYFPTHPAWREFALDPDAPAEAPVLSLDLKRGLSWAESVLDAEGPERVVLEYDGRTLGQLPQDVGAERWRGRHLRAQLLGQTGPAYLRALAQDQAITDAEPEDVERLLTGIDRMTPYFGVRTPPRTWEEQAEQWRRADGDEPRGWPCAWRRGRRHGRRDGETTP